jgi:hypothetical protein
MRKLNENKISGSTLPVQPFINKWYLIDVRLDSAVLQELHQVLDAVVGHAHRLEHPGLVKLFDDPPAFEPKFGV